MTEKKLVYPNEGYSSSGSDADYEQPMTEPKTFKEFIRWLEVYSPVDWEEMQRFEDEAGASVWIRFDLEKEDEDE